MKTPSPKIILAKWLFIFTGIIIFTFTGMQEVAIAIAALVLCNVGYGQDLKNLADNGIVRALSNLLDLVILLKDNKQEKPPQEQILKCKKAVKH